MPAPAGPRCMGARTCTSRRGSRPNVAGMRRAATSTVSRPASSVSSSTKRKKSFMPSVTGCCPALMRWALVTTPDCWAWRKTRVSRTAGTGLPSARRSRSTSPAPTLGSWSTSPTNSRWAPGGTALTSLFASSRSSMDASSTTTRSASSGRSRSYAASPPGLSSSSRCTVDASAPVSSASRLAARPVGAASTTFAFLARASSTMDRTVKDLPQPGPPVSTATFRVNASLTAASCSGARSVPVRPRSQPSALSHATSWNVGIRSWSVRSSRSSWEARATSARWNGTR